MPFVVDVDLARANPALAVLSAICHGGQAEVDGMFPALAEALRSLGPRKAVLYYDVVLAGLPSPARVRWEAAVPAAIRELVLACADLAQLDTWLRRALTATSIDDVIHG